MRNVIGQKFNRWIVLSNHAENKLYLVCKCECGTVKDVRRSHVIYGNSKSCGCLHKELSSARSGNMHKANIKHAACNTPAYKSWCSMLQRCNNVKSTHYKRYGGRGIMVCNNWLQFENFLADMGQPPEKYTIERINNNGNYEKSNCKWASRLEQQSNRNVCRIISWNGVSNTIAEWSRITGIHHNTITSRLNNNLQVDQIFSQDKQINTKGLSLGATSSSLARLARTHCKYGHEYTPENTTQTAKQRICKTCHREKVKRLNAAKRIK